MARTAKLLALSNLVRLRKANRTTVTQPHCFMSRLATAQLAPAEHHELDQEQPERDHPDPFRPKSSSPQTDATHTGSSKKATEINWVPHPRNGIYFPQGYEWVMDDVPETAASLGQTQAYWLRNVHGVEKHDPDIPSADHYLVLNPHHV